MSYFKEKFGKTEAVQDLKEKFVKNRIERTFGASQDAVENRLDTIALSLEQKRLDFANGDMKALAGIIALQIEAEELNRALELTQKEKTLCLGE